MKAGTGRCWKCHVARESWPPLPLPATADDIWPEFLRINLFAKLLLLFFITIIVVFTLDCGRDARRRQEGFCVWMHTWVPPPPPHPPAASLYLAQIARCGGGGACLSTRQADTQRGHDPSLGAWARPPASGSGARVLPPDQHWPWPTTSALRPWALLGAQRTEPSCWKPR